MRFKILHTNDLHSNFTNLAKVKTIINKYSDENTIIVDAGDFVDFKRIEHLGTKGKLAGKLLTACGYDAVAIGNNETFQGIDMFEQMSINSPTPFLSCNLKKGENSLQGVKNYKIIKKAGLRFLIIGVTPEMKEFLTMMGFSFINYHQEIQRILLSEKGNYDISLVISHLGTKRDALLIDKINGIDIVISGHDHKLYEKAIIINKTINNSSGYMGEAVGLLEFDYSDNNMNLLKSELIPTSLYDLDQHIIQLVKENKKLAIANLSEPLFEINESMYHDNIEESPIGNLLADAIKDLLKTDIGIINSGIVNGGVMKGMVSEKNLIDICPSPLNPTYFELRGIDILKALELSLDTDICLNPGKGPGFRGICCGTLNVSGIKVHYNDTEIKRVLINNKSLDREKWYKVASSDYLHRGTVYEPFKNNRNYKYDVQFFKDTLREYLNKDEYIKNALTKRWIKE